MSNMPHAVVPKPSTFAQMVLACRPSIATSGMVNAPMIGIPIMVSTSAGTLVMGLFGRRQRVPPACGLYDKRETGPAGK
jgi:hypothetical protein